MPKTRDAALLITRIAFGGLMAGHGWLKFSNGLDGFGGFVESLELPLAGLLQYIVPILELVGGMAIVAGILTRPVAALLAVHMLAITAYVKFNRFDAGFLSGDATAELELLYAAGFALLALLGAGAYSVDETILSRPSSEQRESVST
jgi:putative oxidoreductase